MSGNILEDDLQVQVRSTIREQEIIEKVIREIAENLESETNAMDSTMSVMDENNDNIENSLNNPGPSMESESESCRNTDKMSMQPETLNSFMDFTSAEVINNPGPSTEEIKSDICHGAIIVPEIIVYPGPPTMEIQSEMCQSADKVSKQPALPASFVEYINNELTNNTIASIMEIESEICHNIDKVSKQPETSNSFVECFSNAETTGNPGPSTTEIQSEIRHSANEVSKQPETLNSFVECFSNETTGNPGPSTTEIQSEIRHSANEVSKLPEMSSSVMDLSSAENIDYSSYSPLLLPLEDSAPPKKLEILNSSTECTSEVIDIPSDSNSDSSDDSSDDSCDDISIINPTSSRSSSDLTDNRLSPNQVETVATCSKRQSIIVNNEMQDGSKKEVVEENNNEVSYVKHVSKKKALPNNPTPGCSKDSDDTAPKLEGCYNYSNLDELLKDAKLIHALMPRFSYRSIYRTLCNNQFARNRIELTLWDLLPVERPPPQFLPKRKCSDEMCSAKHKKNLDARPQRDEVDAALEKKVQECARDEVTADNRKLENRVLAALTREIKEMKKNMPEVTASNSANNDINQQSVIPIKRTKLNHTLDETSYKNLEDDSNRIPKISLRLDPKENMLQLIDKSNTSEPNSRVLRVLKPPKLMLQNNSIPSSRKDERPYKPQPIPLLSPPKLRVIDKNSFTKNLPTTGHSFASTSSRVEVANPNERLVHQHISSYSPINCLFPSTKPKPITVVRTFDLTPNLSSTLSTSSSDKRASDVCLPQFMDSNKIWRPIDMSQRLETKAIVVESTKFANFNPTFPPRVQVLNATTTYNPPNAAPSSLGETAWDCQKPSCSFEREGNNMNTPQVTIPGFQQQQPSLVRTEVKANVQLENVTKDAKQIKINPSKETPKPVAAQDAERKEIILTVKAAKIYYKLIPIFPSVKTGYIKQLCHDHVKDDGQLQDEVLVERLVDVLLNCGQENLAVKKIKPVPEATDSNPAYDLNEQYADLLMIFPEADPVYLRKTAEEIYKDPEQIKEFVQSKLEKPDYPTRAQYLAKKKITQQQKQYTTDFQVEQFLQIFPDPSSHFEDDKRKCEFNPHAVDFLKYYFSKLRVNTLVKAYTQYKYNLSLTAKALEALNPDMKTKRYCNKMVLTEDIPFLQECAFIQHKAELRSYMFKVKVDEELEFNRLKVKNELLECQCCYDNECMPSKCSTCEDGHVFCNSCIIRSTEVVLGDGNTRIECLLQCGCEFPLSVLQQVLPPTKFSILLCKRQEAEIMAAGLEGLVSCPFCHFATIPPPEDKIIKCLNPECMKESCRLCKELNHIPLKCNEKKDESARLYLEEKMTEALVRRCYRCNKKFYKEEGCNKMTCVCGAQMCYICDKPVTDYKHFQGQGAERSNLCPLWSDDRRMNAESVIRVCQETMKQIKEKDPQIDINVNALLPKLPPKSKGPHEDIPNALIHDRIARQFQR